MGDTGCGYADEHIGALHGVGQIPHPVVAVGHTGDVGVGGVEPLHALAQDAEAVDHDKVLNAHVQQVAADGNAGRAGAVDDDAHVADALAHHLEGIEQGGGHDDGGAVLVVVKDGNVADVLEPALDLKATGGADVLQVDAAEATRKQIDGADDLVDVFGTDAKRESIHVGKGLKERALALHDGHACLGANVTKAQNSRAVRDDGHEIGAAGEVIRGVRVLLDLQAGLGHTGSVGEREIGAVVDGGARDDLDLSLPFVVLLERLLTDVHGSTS